MDVIGLIPPCKRCKKTEENAKKAAAKLNVEGIKVEVNKLNIMSKETISKYGVVLSPAIAVNNVIKIMGKVPDASVVERLLRAEL